MSELKKGGSLSHSWDIFKQKDSDPFRQPISDWYSAGVGDASRIDRAKLSPCKERTIVASLYNKIAVSVASVPIRHVRVDENDRYTETIKSGFDRCLTVQSNIDQSGRELIFDIVISMFDEGCVAVVPTETTANLRSSNPFDILSMRTGKITKWRPRDVTVELYNDYTGLKQELNLPKERIAIITNPFYSVMNERNSTLQRLIRKLNLLDKLDDEKVSSKFNMILQLPYTIKSDARREQAQKRLKELETQLDGSTYGIAYVDGTEKVTQLNRPLENDLLKQVEDLKNDLYSQLGVTKEVFDGTADEKTMLNYQNQAVEPVLSAITDEFTRKFITRTAYTQGQRVMFLQNPFGLVPIDNIADIADKFTRNEILSSNDIRSIIGMKPSDDPEAEELRNKNLNKSAEEEMMPEEEYAEDDYVEEEENPVGELPLSDIM